MICGYTDLQQDFPVAHPADPLVSVRFSLSPDPFSLEVTREKAGFLFPRRNRCDRGFFCHRPRIAINPLPAVGQLAPTFTLPSQDGSQISLESFRGKWVVLYFYPKDMTTGCTIEAHNFQRDQAKFDAVNAVILGVSVDTPDSHKQFCTKEGLTFRLLADPEHKVVDAYGSLGSFGPSPSPTATPSSSIRKARS